MSRSSTGFADLVAILLMDGASGSCRLELSIVFITY